MAEGQESRGQIARAHGGEIDFVGHAQQRSLRGEFYLEQFAVAENSDQQVIEIVGHAAGETAYCFHFLGLAELVLEGAAFGDIADDGDDAGLARQFDGVGGHLHGAHFAGFYGQAHFQVAGFGGTF
jgi:hypothetical protein